VVCFLFWTDRGFRRTKATISPKQQIATKRFVRDICDSKFWRVFSYQNENTQRNTAPFKICFCRPLWSAFCFGAHFAELRRTKTAQSPRFAFAKLYVLLRTKAKQRSVIPLQIFSIIFRPLWSAFCFGRKGRPPTKNPMGSAASLFLFFMG